MINELTNSELEMVSGSGKGAQAAGYVVGRTVGTIMYAGGVAANSLVSFGGWLGIAIYDATHDN